MEVRNKKIVELYSFYWLFKLIGVKDLNYSEVCWDKGQSFVAKYASPEF